MRYSIRHVTRYQYDRPVSESVTEVRMKPRSENNQQCYSFTLTVQPHAMVAFYEDYLGNTIHHFDVPTQLTQLLMTAEATVDVQPPPPLPDALPPEAWAQLENELEEDFWEFLQPSRYALPTERLQALAEDRDLKREADPLTTLHCMNRAMYESFVYAPQTTHVESTIDEALETRRGVCQDITHIMIALGRRLGIPCRYVSGYLFHRNEDQDRSAEDATHAWVEAWLPDLGWIGFDPTIHLIAGERHIRVAIGRDYADVPPTRGTFKGKAEEELSVGVRVTLTNAKADSEDEFTPMPRWTSIPEDIETRFDAQQQ
jgi:transglutaminase-like putative cysteine protease